MKFEKLLLQSFEKRKCNDCNCDFFLFFSFSFLFFLFFNFPPSYLTTQ